MLVGNKIGARVVSPLSIMPTQGQKRKRDREYQKDSVAACIAANPTSKEASVWQSLKGKSRAMQTLQDEFMKDFTAHAFNTVEGSKWTQYLCVQEYEDEGEYMTEKQIGAAECNCPIATQSQA